QLAQIAALLAGASGPKTGPVLAPNPKVTNGPVIALARTEDFRNAAATISGTRPSFRTEQKLLRIWTDHGIPPTEVAEDALRDRTIAEVIRSDSGALPDAYVRAGEPRPAASAEPNGPTQLAESAQADSATLPVKSKAAPVEADGRSSANLTASEPALIIAEAKRVRMKRPPPTPQRPFDEDYPRYALTDAQGQLLHDIE